MRVGEAKAPAGWDPLCRGWVWEESIPLPPEWAGGKGQGRPLGMQLLVGIQLLVEIQCLVAGEGVSRMDLS